MSQAAAADPVDLADPRWYPADVDVQRGIVGMLRIDEQVVDQSTFMDNRLAADFSGIRPLQLAELAMRLPSAPAPAWLLHTSFCGSSLLSAALLSPPRLMVYREPLILRRLADAKHAGLPIEPWIPPVVRLLARPWSAGGGVVVKPTHAALGLAPALLASSDSRAVVVTSSLLDFLVSNIKKTRETQSRIPELCERAFGALVKRPEFAPPAFEPPSLLAAAGLQWTLQRILLQEIVDACPGRLRIVDVDDVTDRLHDVVEAGMAWWGLPVPPEALSRRIDEVSGMHAKAPGVAYNGERRRAEAALLAAEFATDLARAQRWLERWVLPEVDSRVLDLATGPQALLRRLAEAP